MTALAFVALALVAAVARGAKLTPETEEAIRTNKQIYVSTRRRDGSESKVVPVWFMYDGDAILFTTGPKSHKARRIRHGSPLFVRVGSASAPRFEGHAELVDDPTVAARMAPVYKQKYWIAWLGFFVPDPDRVRTGKTAIVRVTPAQ